MTKTQDNRQTKVLLQKTKLLDKPTKFFLADRLNTTEAYDYVPSLVEVPEKEIIQETIT